MVSHTQDIPGLGKSVSNQEISIKSLTSTTTLVGRRGAGGGSAEAGC